MLGTADLHVPFFKARVQGGMDARGKRFKIYTPKYLELKSNKFHSPITGERYAHPKARVSSSQVYPPDLTLTGLMLQNLKRRSYSKTEWVIGFDGEAAEKVQGNRDHGRDIMTNIPNKEKDFLLRQLGKLVDKEFRKLKNVTLTVGK